MVLHVRYYADKKIGCVPMVPPPVQLYAQSAAWEDVKGQALLRAKIE